jgi:hypothetical protein
MKHNKTSTLPNVAYWREYARKHPESAQREWDKISNESINYICLSTHADIPEQLGDHDGRL